MRPFKSYHDSIKSNAVISNSEIISVEDLKLHQDIYELSKYLLSEHLFRDEQKVPNDKVRAFADSMKWDGYFQALTEYLRKNMYISPTKADLIECDPSLSSLFTNIGITGVLRNIGKMPSADNDQKNNNMKDNAERYLNSLLSRIQIKGNKSKTDSLVHSLYPALLVFIFLSSNLVFKYSDDKTPPDLDLRIKRKIPEKTNRRISQYEVDEVQKKYKEVFPDKYGLGSIEAVDVESFLDIARNLKKIDLTLRHFQYGKLFQLIMEVTRCHSILNLYYLNASTDVLQKYYSQKASRDLVHSMESCLFDHNALCTLYFASTVTAPYQPFKSSTCISPEIKGLSLEEEEVNLILFIITKIKDYYTEKLSNVGVKEDYEKLLCVNKDAFDVTFFWKKI